MPPRRRSRVRNTRRDAALDAMGVFGFPDDLVRRTLNKLLRVYGQDGWGFIEADSYKVLMEELLDPNDEDQPNDDPTQENVGVMENQLGGGQVEENLGDDPPQQDLAEENEVNEPLEDVQNFYAVVDSVVEPEVGGNDIRVQEMTAQEQTEEVEPAVENHVEREVSVPAVTPTHTTSVSHRTREAAKKPRRKPCFGWISSDDDEEDEVMLTGSK